MSRWIYDKEISQEEDEEGPFRIIKYTIPYEILFTSRCMEIYLEGVSVANLIGLNGDRIVKSWLTTLPDGSQEIKYKVRSTR